jgi:hypothetical protein
MNLKPALNSKQVMNKASRAFIIAAVASMVLPFIPILGKLLLPFDYLATHVHELFHALAGVLTNGRVVYIKVFQNSEGLTMTAGGMIAIIYSAGYIGTALIGAWIIRVSSSPRQARLWIKILGIAILASNILWVRGDAFGWAVGFVWVLLLSIASFKFKDNEVLFAAQFIGVQLCLNGFKALRDLLLLSKEGSGFTDAYGMQQVTMLPAIFWALLWLAVSAIGVFFAVSGVVRGDSGLSEQKPVQ